jgi:hypothetical protein
MNICILSKTNALRTRHETPKLQSGDCFEDEGPGIPARRQSPEGKIQSGFFRRLGFDPADPRLLEDELMRLARENDVLLSTETEFGIRYVIDGWVLSPAAARADIRTVWFVDQGEEIPRFVTAHPVRRRR